MTDPYQKYLDDPENLLQAEQRDLIPDDAPEGGTLHRDTLTDPKGFNFITENSVVVSNLQGLIHNGFAGTDFEDPERYIPSLAYKITANDDYTEYTIHLKEGIYWHPLPHPDIGSDQMAWAREKHEMTAEDAAFTFELLKNPQVEAGALKSYFEDMDRVEVVDRYTLKVYWKKKTYQSKSFTMGMSSRPQVALHARKDGSLMPEETLGKAFNNHWASNYPIGTGPYKFVKYEKGQRIVLERNDDYFDEKPPSSASSTRSCAMPHTVCATSRRASSTSWRRSPRRPTSPRSSTTQRACSTRTCSSTASWTASPTITWAGTRQAPVLGQEGALGAHARAQPQGRSSSRSSGWASSRPGRTTTSTRRTTRTSSRSPSIWISAPELLDEAGWKDTDGDGIRDKVVNGNKPTSRSRSWPTGTAPSF